MLSSVHVVVSLLRRDAPAQSYCSYDPHTSDAYKRAKSIYESNNSKYTSGEFQSSLKRHFMRFTAPALVLYITKDSIWEQFRRDIHVLTRYLYIFWISSV